MHADVDGLARRLPHIRVKKAHRLPRLPWYCCQQRTRYTCYGIVPRLYRLGSVRDRDLASDRDRAIVRLWVSYNVASCAFIFALWLQNLSGHGPTDPTASYGPVVVLKFIHITIRLLLFISDIQSAAALPLLLSVNTDLFLFIYGITNSQVW